MHPLADMAPSWTPYPYGFNILLFTDPNGNFESIGQVYHDGVRYRSLDAATGAVGIYKYCDGCSIGRTSQSAEVDKRDRTEKKGAQKRAPDTDKGKGENFSLEKMYFHFQFGGGNPMTINMSWTDFSGKSQTELGLKGMKLGDIRRVIFLRQDQQIEQC